MDVRLLGPLEIRRDDGSDVAISAQKVRALVLALALDVGRARSVDRLVEDLWEDRPPARPIVSLRSYVSNLRRLLPGTPERPRVVTRGRGYLLDADPDEVDLHRFEAGARAGRAALEAGDPGSALAVLDDALALWRGPALVDVEELAFAQASIARLDELRIAVTEDRFDALLGTGRHVEVVAEADGHVVAHPLRERPRLQLMLALHRSGRSPEALDVERDLRRLLGEELGLDPSPEVQRLTGRILRQDPDLVHVAVPGRSRPSPVDPGAATPAASPTSGLGPEAGTDDTGHVVPGSPTAVDHDPSGLLGRDDERARLGRALDRLGRGTGGVLVVAGEAGIGKTALLDDLAARARARDLPVVWGRCLETPGAPAFWPWTQVLRALADDLDDHGLVTALRGHAAAVGQLVPEIAARTGARADVPTAAPQAARFVLHDAVRTFLGRVAGGRGLVVVVDDLHWADLASCELVAVLGAEAAASGVLLAVSHRGTAADRTPELEQALGDLARVPDVEHVVLGGLAPDDVHRLVRRVAGDAGDDDAGRVVQRAGGNPFYASQLARLVAERDVDVARGVPVGVREVVVRRLARLPDAVRDTLDVAAVLGQDLDPQVLARCRGDAVSDVVDVLDQLDVAVAHGLVVADDGHARYRFVHALVRDTIERELPTGRAVRLHQDAATVLEGLPRPPVQELAQHLWLAADAVEVERPVRWLREAAEEAVAVYAYEQAEESLRRALHLLGHAGDEHAALELAVRLRLIQVLNSLHGWTSGTIEEVAGRVFELAEREGVGPEVTAMWWALWAMYMTRGDLDRAQDGADRLHASVVPDGQPFERLAAHVAMAYTGLFRGLDRDDVLRHLDLGAAAERDTDRVRLGATPEHLAVALRITRAMAHAVFGEAAAAAAAADDAVAVGDELGDPFRQSYARLFGAFAHAVLDDPERTHAHSRVGVELCRRAGLQGIVALLLPNHLWAEARLGGPAEELAAAALEADRAVGAAGQRHAVPHGRVLLAEIQLLAGDVDAARATLASAVALADEIGEVVYGPQVARVRAAIDEADRRRGAGPTR